MQERFSDFGRRSAAVAFAAAAALCAMPAGADESSPPVALDELLKLPPSLEIETQSRGQITKVEWRKRFDAARTELADARAALAKTQAKLTEAAGGSSAWKMSAPGIGNIESTANEGPSDYGMSNELRRNREEVERSERRLSELEIEANLAGVPDDWRGTPLATDAESAQAPVQPTE